MPNGDFVAGISIFPFSFAPTGFALCQGQLMAISQNTALFSLVGTFYGGNGTSNFALPDLQCRTPIGMGQGPGLSPYAMAQQGGSDTVTLLTSEIPSHTHALEAIGHGAGASTPSAGVRLGVPRDNAYTTATGAPVALATSAIAVNGSSQPHDNRSPYLGLNFCIALQGDLPASLLGLAMHPASILPSGVPATRSCPASSRRASPRHHHHRG